MCVLCVCVCVCVAVVCVCVMCVSVCVGCARVNVEICIPNSVSPSAVNLGRMTHYNNFIIYTFGNECFSLGLHTCATHASHMYPYMFTNIDQLSFHMFCIFTYNMASTPNRSQI